jgi:hypothetical protein
MSMNERAKAHAEIDKFFFLFVPDLGTKTSINKPRSGMQSLKRANW